MRSASFVAASLLLAGPAMAGGHGTTAGYALADGGARLVVFSDLSAPEAMQTVSLETPVAAIAWRPVTGALVAFSRGAIHEIDPATGKMTNLGAQFMSDTAIADGALVAFDFNNKIDAVRAVSSEGDNLVYFPEGFGNGDEKAGSVRRFTGLAYAEGDANAGATPLVFANAYTNAINGMTAGDTFQYALDAGTDALVSLANNAGTLETIAPVTVDGAPIDLAASGGFDIVSPAEGQDMAYAILHRAGDGAAGLYTLDLETGAATLVADLGRSGYTSFAASLGM